MAKNPEEAKPDLEVKPEPPKLDPAKEAAKQEATDHELRAQQVLESGGRGAGVFMKSAAEAWEKAGEKERAAVASKLAGKYEAEDAPKPKEKGPA